MIILIGIKIRTLCKITFSFIIISNVIDRSKNYTDIDAVI